MKLIVHAASLAHAPRMRSSAWALGLRGHDVRWLGGPPPPGADVADAGAPPALARARDVSGVDVVLGGAPGILPAAWAGWMAGAHAAVIDLAPAAAARWAFLERAAWGALDAVGMLEPDADGAAPPWSGFGADALVRWSEAPAAESPDAAHPDTEILERACERLASRRRGPAARAAVFLDRDGTLVVEVGYLSSAEELRLLPGVPAALRALRAAGYALVVVSNQSGVGRGLFPMSRVYEAMARLRRELRTHGVELDAIYFCPHRPDAGCDCRKPSPGLLRRAAANLGLSLAPSAMVGDKRLDVETGHRAGGLGVLVRTGYGKDEEQRQAEPGESPPDHVADDLAAAAAWLRERHPAVRD